MMYSLIYTGVWDQLWINYVLALDVSAQKVDKTFLIKIILVLSINYSWKKTALRAVCDPTIEYRKSV